MSVYRIAYDMNVPGERRSKISRYIQDKFAYCKIGETDWLIRSTSQSAYNLWETHFSQFFDTTDRALLIRCAGDYQGLLTEEQWDWIRGSSF